MTARKRLEGSLHDLADWDEKKQVSVIKSNAQTLIHLTLERLESVRRAGSNVVILISVASWLQPARNTNMLGVITTFIRAAMKRNLIVVPADFAFWGDHCVGSSGAPREQVQSCVIALPALVSAAVDISWTLHRVMSTANAAKTLGLLYKKTMYPPDEDAKVKAERILQTKVWDDSLTYPAAPSAKIAGTDSSGQSHDVEMTDAASEVTPPAQEAPPSEAKAPARQAEPKGPGVKDEEEPDFAGSAEDELGSDGPLIRGGGGILTGLNCLASFLSSRYRMRGVCFVHVLFYHKRIGRMAVWLKI